MADRTITRPNWGGGNEVIDAVAIDRGSPNGIFAGIFLDTGAWVAEISADDSELLFSTLFGGSITGFVNGLAVSPNDSIYFSGGTYAHDFPTTDSSFQPDSTAQLSGFAANLSITKVQANPDQTASPNGGTTVTENVSSSGNTTAMTSSTNPVDTPPPFGFTAVSQFTDISTTATYTGEITVCLNYNPGQIVQAANLSSLHFLQGQWANITTSNNPQTGVICGQVTSFSPFVIAQSAGVTPTPTASAKPTATPTSIVSPTSTSTVAKTPTVAPTPTGIPTI